MKKNGKKPVSDLKKAASYVIQPEEYEDAPLLTEGMAATGVWKRNGKKIGRPSKPDKKVSVHLRLDPDVRDAFRATGAGWQSRINAALRAAIPQ